MRNIKITRPMRGRTDTQAQLDENNLPVEESRNSAPLNITRAAKPKPPTSEMTPREALQGMPDLLGRTVDTQGFDIDLSSTDVPIYADKNIEAQLERDQSAFGLFANTIARGASTVVLGGAEALSYFADAENIGMALQEGEKDYSNWFADLMEKAQEEVREVTPIYRSERGQQDFAWDSATWWANNIESIATTASMFIPTAGIMRGLAFAGKATRGLLNTTKIANVAQDASKITKGLNKLMYGEKAESLLRTGASATISRYMENTMEANETFNSVYQELIAEGVSDQEARLKAGEAAANTWKANWINIATDLVQYGALTKGLNYAAPAAKGLRKQLAKGGYDYIKNAAGEGLEEFGQYVISQESARAAKNDRSFFELEGLDRRMSDYVKDPEAQASALLGAVGGTFFKAAGSTGQLYNRLAGVYEAQDADLAKRTFLDKLDVTNSYLVDGSILMNQAVQYGNAGKFSSLRSFYQDLADKTDQELEAEGLTPEQIEDKRKKDAEILSDLDFLEREYSRLTEDASKDNVVKIEELGSLYEKHKLAQANDVIAAEKTKIEEEISNQIDTNQLSIKNKEYKLNSYKKYRDKYKEQVGKKEGSEGVVSYLDNKIEQLEKEIAEEKQQLEERTGDAVIPTTSRDVDLANMNDQEAYVDLRQQESQRVIQNANTVEGKAEIQKEHEQRQLDMTKRSIRPSMTMNAVKSLVNEKDTPGYSDLMKKLEGVATLAEMSSEIPQEGSETFEQDFKQRYRSTPLLYREIQRMKALAKGNTKAISALDKVETAEEFYNLYSNNADVKKIFNDLMVEHQKRLEKKEDDEVNYKEDNYTDAQDAESNEPPADASEDANPAKEGRTMSKLLAQQNALYVYNAQEGTVQFIGAENNRRMSIEDARKLGYDDFIPGQRVLFTKEGIPVKHAQSTVKINGVDVEIFTDEEIAALNDPSVDMLGKQLIFSVPADVDFNKDSARNADDLLIMVSLVTEVNGVEKELKVGMIKNSRGLLGSDPIKQLRQSIFNEFKNSGQTGGVFKSSIDTVRSGGRVNEKFNSTFSKKSIPPHILNENYLVVITDTTADGTVKLIDDNARSQLPKGTDIDYNDNSKLVDKRGNVFILIQTPNGDFKPVRMKPKKLSQLPKEQAVVNSLIDALYDKIEDPALSVSQKFQAIKEFNKNSLDYIPYTLYYDGNKGKIKEYRQGKDGVRVFKTGYINRAEAKDIASKKVMRFNVDKMNTGSYNADLSKKGWYEVNIDPEMPFINSMITMHIDSVPDIKATKVQAQPATTTTEAQKRVEKQKEKLEDIESQLNPDVKHPLFNVGQEYNDGMRVEAEFDDQRTDKTKEGVRVISRVRKPATVDSNGVMTSAAVVEVTLFDSLEQAKESIASRYEKAKANREKRLAEAEAQLTPTTEGTVDIPVNNMTIVYNPQTGEMTFKTTGGTPNETVRNKALVRYETTQGTVRNVELTDKKGKVTKYAVLSDDRVISLNNSSVGKQLKAKGLINKILEQAGEVSTPTTEAITPAVKGSIVGQGTEINLEIVGDSGKEFLLTVDRKGKISLFSEKQSDGSYQSGNTVPPKKAVDNLYNKYIPETTKTAITNWVNSFTGSWADETSEDGKNYIKAETELNSELSKLTPVQPTQQTSVETTTELQVPEKASIYETDGLFDVEYEGEGIIGDYLPTYEAAVKRAQEFDAQQKAAEEGEVISKKEYDAFVNDGTVDQARINTIADKIIKGEGLSIREQKILEGRAKEVEERIQEVAKQTEQNDVSAEEPTVNVPMNTAIDFTGQTSSLDTLGQEPTEEEDKKKDDDDNEPFSESDVIKRVREATDPDGSYELWNQEKEVAWFKKNYPNVPLEVLDDLREVVGKGGPESWGLFRNASVYIATNAKTGTLYHEAFHVVFNLMLTDAERQQILEEGATKAKGAVAIEEYWADEYMEYQLSEGASAHTLPAKVADFFKRLWHMIRIAAERTGFASPASMNDYMYRVSRGLYNKGLIRGMGGVKFRNSVTRFRPKEIENNGLLNAREADVAKRLMNGILIIDVLPKYKTLLNMPHADDTEIIKAIIKKGIRDNDPRYSVQALYTNVYQFLKTASEDKRRSEKDRKTLGRLLNSFATEEGGTLKMKRLYIKAARSLQYYGIRMAYDTGSVDTTNDNIEESDLLEETEDVIENWMVKEKFISAKEKFSQKSKALFSMVPVKNAKFGGFPVFETPAHVFNKLSSRLSDSKNLEDMKRKLDDLINYNPGYKVIRDALNSEDSTIATEFWKNIGQRKFTPFLVLQNNGKRTRTFIGNEQDARKDLKATWQQNFFDSSFYDVSNNIIAPTARFDEKYEVLSRVVDEIKEENKKNRLDKEGNISRSQAGEIYNVLKFLSIPVTRNEVIDMFSTPDNGENVKGGKERFLQFASGLTYYMNRIKKGENPYDGNKEASDNFNDMMEVYMIAYPETYQATFRTGEKELAYSFLQSRFMQNFMRELQNPNKKERDAYIKERMEDPFYKNSPFLSRILEIPDLAGNMRMAVFDTLRTNDGNAIPYTKLTRQQLEALKMNAFFNLQFGGKTDTAYAYFMMPIFSDSTSSAFLRFKKYTTEEAKAALVDSARQERDRIEWLKGRIKPVQKEYNKWLADQNDRNKPYKEKAKLPEELKDIEYNMLKNGLKYQIFRELNDMDLSTESQFEDAVMNIIQENLNSELRSLIEEGVFDKDGNDATDMLDERILDEKVRRDNLTQYVYNTMLMNIQTLVTFGGDTAFYKAGKDGLTDFTDVYKRIKEIWSPGDYLNADPSNKYVHVKEGEISEIVSVRNDYKVIYVKDPGEVENIVSESIKELERVHKNNPKKDQIIDAFSKLNNTDAATIIDPIRAREIHLGSKGLNAPLYEMYDSLITGKTIRHIGEEATSIVYKPFQFMFEKSTDKNNTTRFNPVQHKNAEFLMTPSMAVGNPKLEKMMEKFGYVFKKDGSWTYDSSKRITDAVMYTTAVKVGEKGTIDNIEDAVETDAHTFKNANYRIQMETPEHHIDTDIMEGTQYRKLIIENVDPNAEYTLPDGTKVKGDKLVKDFNEAVYLNVKESYEELKKLFYDEETGLPDNKKILTALREQAIEQELPDDFLTALDFLENNEGYTVDENGNLKKASQVTVLPLWHPDIVYQVESMMNSFFKNRVTKQRTDKSAGASLYNASSWGFENENPKGLRKPKIKWSEDGGIEYMEAIMPVTSEALLDYADENGFIDIKKIEEIEPDLLKGVFYRIPTEHKYSMFHIKVIGFLPQGVAGQIILPDEATTLAGLDFDIDKLYGLLYNIEVYGQPLPEKEIAYQNYINSSNFSKKLGRNIIRKNIPNFDDARARREFAAKEGLRWNADENVFTKKSLRKVESSMDTKKGRDNLKLDIAFSILSNKRTAVEQTTPGGFETLKDLVDMILKAQGADKGQINPMLNSTVREIHNRMMTGLDLIGIFANHTVNHSLMTLGNVAFTKPIKFNGKELAGLSQMMVGDVNIADLKEFLAAAVDNGKDPVASFLNVTTVTADLVAAMVRVGHPIESVMMFTANPTLKDFTNRLSKAGNTYSSTITDTIDEIESELKVALRKVAGSTQANKILDKGLSSLYLTYDRKTKKGNLLDSIEKSNMSTEDLIKEKDLNEIKLRLTVISSFRNLMNNQASDLKTVMSAMRYDSSKNAAGPTVAHTKNRLDRYDSALEVKGITGFRQLILDIESNPERYVAAFREYGLKEAVKIIGEVTNIPYASTDEFNIFNFTEKTIKQYIAPEGRAINPDDTNKIYRAIETLIATSYETFKPAELKRVIENLPSEISNFISANEDSPYVPFLRHFMAIPSKQQKALAIMKFTRNGVDKIQQTDIKNDWYSMINDSDPNVSKIANDLVKYAFATSGYVVTPFKFTDMIPVMYTSDLREPGKKRFVESVEDIYSKDMFDYENSGPIVLQMIDQILRNMYRSFSFVKYINPDEVKPYKVNGTYRQKVWHEDVTKKEKGETFQLQYIKTVINDKQGMRSALMKAIDSEGDYIIYEQVQPLGLYNEMLEFDYDSAVLNKPLVSQMESLEYIPTKEETEAKDLNISDVGIAQTMIEMMNIIPDFNINEIRPVENVKEVKTHPFIQKIEALPNDKKVQLKNLVGSTSRTGYMILEAILNNFTEVGTVQNEAVEKLFEKYQDQINAKHPDTTADVLKEWVNKWDSEGKSGLNLLDQYLKKCYG